MGMPRLQELHRGCKITYLQQRTQKKISLSIPHSPPVLPSPLRRTSSAPYPWSSPPPTPPVSRDPRGSPLQLAQHPLVLRETAQAASFSCGRQPPAQVTRG